MSLFTLEMLWLISIFPAESPVLEHKGKGLIEGGSASGGNDTMSPHCPVLVPGVRSARGATVAGVGTSSVSAPYHRQSASTGPRGELSC